MMLFAIMLVPKQGMLELRWDLTSVERYFRVLRINLMFSSEGEMKPEHVFRMFGVTILL